jgi:hypothetical protein
MDNLNVFFCVSDAVSLPVCQKTFVTKYEPTHQSCDDDTQMDPNETFGFEKDTEYHKENHKVMESH